MYNFRLKLAKVELYKIEAFRFSIKVTKLYCLL